MRSTESPIVTNTLKPELVGNERRVLVSELSGRSNIVAKATKYKIEHDGELMDEDSGASVQDLKSVGYQFEAAEASFDLLIKNVAGTYCSNVRATQYRVNVDTDREAHRNCAVTEAIGQTAGGGGRTARSSRRARSGERD